MELTNDEIMDVLVIKVFPLESIGYRLQPGIYEVSDFNKTVAFLLRDIVKVSNTIDDIKI